jgi:hypothetical protein
MPTIEPVLAAPRGSMPNPPGLIRLSQFLIAKFPGTHSGGWYNPASRLSGGGYSPHTVTTALDVMCPEDIAPQIIRYVVSIADAINLQQCIAWHEIITVQRWSQGIRPYAADDHSFGNGHAHIAIGLHAAQEFNASWLGANPTPIPTPPPPTPTQESERMLVIFRGAPHAFWYANDGQLWHSWPGNKPEPMRKYVASRGCSWSSRASSSRSCGSAVVSRRRSWLSNATCAASAAACRRTMSGVSAARTSLSPR